MTACMVACPGSCMPLRVVCISGPIGLSFFVRPVVDDEKEGEGMGRKVSHGDYSLAIDNTQHPPTHICQTDSSAP